MARRLPPLLDLPTGTAVARIAGGYLDDAAAALRRVKGGKDPEALHDFRVAIRRLRSLLRAYRPWLGRAAGKKVRRRLRDLGRATNAARDAEVQIVWLEAQRQHLARRERAGLNWLVRRRRDEKRQAYRTARRHAAKDVERTAQMLRDRLATLEGREPMRFREAVGLLLQEQATEIERRLAAIAGADDDEAAHEARIHAKRLRYLMEPLQREVPEARAVVRRTKRLQDLLGELHDMHVQEADLATAVEEAATEMARRLHTLAVSGDRASLARARRRDERLGLVALAARARERRDELFAELARTWLRGRGQALLAQIAALAAVTAPPDDSVEIERKFLLTGLPPQADTAPAQEIEQGWLPGKRLRERLRRVQDGAGERFFRTVKFGAGVERIEIEEETTADLFAALWPHTVGCRVRKRRHRVADGSLTWEVDVFADRELVLAEVELPHPETTVEPPAWLEPFVVREVTGEPAYVNLNLAR
ncbi:MAG: CHAD domain-containing protein [Gemmatimonadota bacterium]|nr:CHAD domain-containing protein [Gemmatimonadota bacterium]